MPAPRDAGRQHRADQERTGEGRAEPADVLPIGVGIANASRAAAMYSAMPIRSGRSQRAAAEQQRAPRATRAERVERVGLAAALGEQSASPRAGLIAAAARTSPIRARVDSQCATPASREQARHRAAQRAADRQRDAAAAMPRCSA